MSNIPKRLKRIRGYKLKDYYATPSGRVYKKNKDGTLHQMSISDDGGNGYNQIKVTDSEGHRKNVDVHKMIGNTFVRGGKNSEVINHKDGDKSNSSATNLEGTTQSQNIQHAWDTGLEGGDKSGKNVDENLLFTAINAYGGLRPLVEALLAEVSKKPVDKDLDNYTDPAKDFDFIQKAHTPDGNRYGFSIDQDGNQIEHSPLSKAEEYYNISRQFVSERGAEEAKRASRDLNSLYKQLSDKAARIHDEWLGMVVTGRKTFDDNGKLVRIPDNQRTEIENQRRQAFQALVKQKQDEGNTLLSGGPEGLVKYVQQYRQQVRR